MGVRGCSGIGSSAVRVVVVAFVVVVAVVKVMPPCLWWRRGYCSLFACGGGEGTAAPRSPPRRGYPRPCHPFPNPFHMHLYLCNLAALVFSILLRVVLFRSSNIISHGRSARSDCSSGCFARVATCIEPRRTPAAHRGRRRPGCSAHPIASGSSLAPRVFRLGGTSWRW